MTTESMQSFLQISLALSAERDRARLLSSILDTSMNVAKCDAGTLYLLEDDGLHFCRMVTRSQGIRQGGHDAPITLPPVPLNPIYVCSWVILNNRSIRVDDVAGDTRFDFTGSQRYDAMTGYHTRTMLVVPMANDRGDLIGVLQLINALDDNGDVVPFDPENELLVTALASQASISITNMQYSEQITRLLDSLVGALSTAIDERTPYNANHTRNMVRYAAGFLDWLEKTNHPWVFDADRRRTFLLSVWLHDVGKLVIPLEVMDKDTRLGRKLSDIENRFKTIRLLDRCACAAGEITEDDYHARLASLEEALSVIRSVNAAGFLPDEKLALIDEIAARQFTDEDGEVKHWLTEEEHTMLSVRKGTLTADERVIMESHVLVTSRILRQVSFPKCYEKVPEWAAAHHELLNGRGYPAHRAADEIPPEVRLLTILDVFDALTARDRPYKPGMPVEKAFSILRSMAEEGSVDGDILSLFEESRAYSEPDTIQSKENNV